MEEIWKPVKGYETSYEVSNLGKVRSLDRYEYMKNGRVRHRIGMILKPGYRSGYQYVRLCANDVQVSKAVHRLVAEAFIPNPNNLSFVNHKDEVRDNNIVTNLEWCTPKYNLNYGTSRTRLSNSMKLYYSTHEVSEETRQKISLKCSGKNNGMYGKHHTAESNQKMREAQKKYRDKQNNTKALFDL